jgi:TctA family transporter
LLYYMHVVQVAGTSSMPECSFPAPGAVHTVLVEAPATLNIFDGRCGEAVDISCEGSMAAG